MKKLYFSIILMLAAFVSVSAKVIYLGVNLVSPATGATLTVGTPFNEMVVITNNGPAAIVPGDTFFYADPATPQGQVYYRINQNKAVGDTIQISKTGLTLTGGTNGPANYCIYAYVSNGNTITPDSVFSDCNSVTIAGASTQGVNTTLQARETVASSVLNIFPNPATGVINLDYAAQNNSEVVARVFDVTGREVMVQNYGSSFPGKTGFQLNLQSLINGLYIVELRQDGVKSVGRVNKN